MINWITNGTLHSFLAQNQRNIGNRLRSFSCMLLSGDTCENQNRGSNPTPNIRSICFQALKHKTLQYFPVLGIKLL